MLHILCRARYFDPGSQTGWHEWTGHMIVAVSNVRIVELIYP